MQRTLANRSGRVISLSRLLLSVVFITAIWLDPSQPTAFPEAGYILLTAYVAFAVGALLLTWDNWRRDWKFAWPFHVVDILLFSVMVYLTDGYTSPFFTLFVFLLFSAAVRWNWRATAMTALVVTGAFFLAGALSLQFAQGDFELQRLIFRTSYLLVVSALFVWFGQHLQAAWQSAHSDLGKNETSLREILETLIKSSGAPNVSVLWWDDEEPWVYRSTATGKAYDYQRFEPQALQPFFDLAAGASGLLGDARGVVALEEEAGRLVERPANSQHYINQILDFDRFAAAPFSTIDIHGWIVLAGTSGLSVDDLKEARTAAKGVARFFDRTSRERSLEERVAAESGLTLARDLHDSVVQIIAGASYRLNAMHGMFSDNGPLQAEIDKLRSELTAEHADLRALIARLRGQPGHVVEQNFGAEMAQVLARISRQWGVTCTLGHSPERLTISAECQREIGLMLRETAANAVKHGGAREIAVECLVESGRLLLTIFEDGSGFNSAMIAEDGETITHLPLSLSERVKKLDGDLEIVALNSGSRTRISLPMERLS
ncbi:sensor histidine kinase [Blastomonas marina]|uniref:Sensor histidine kinase n=1 Tax=Blastomonas marina TaxID=1867408 RepID=A0ABQ1FDL2_9SPHN|nr:histidine kinase [Blastomonas marina]GGA07039.1 sensor histidine kinase [Blastomonas marina]